MNQEAPLRSRLLQQPSERVGRRADGKLYGPLLMRALKELKHKRWSSDAHWLWPYFRVSSALGARGAHRTSKSLLGADVRAPPKSPVCRVP